MNKARCLIKEQKFILYILLCIAIVGIIFVGNRAYTTSKEKAAAPLYSAEVIDVMAVSENATAGNLYEVHFRFKDGPRAGEKEMLMHRTMNQPDFDIYPKAGDDILVIDAGDGGYAISDYERLPGVVWIFVLFVFLLMLLGRKTGIRSLLVLGIAIFLIIKVLIPLILQYHHAIIFSTILVSSVIVLITQFMINGFHAKSYGAIIGTIGGILVASFLAMLAIHSIFLTGFENEFSTMLKIRYLKDVDFKDILFAGVILGALGAVMDVAISIASAQYEMKQLAPKTNFVELFKSGMNIGKDVMGTMANTLVLAYMGSSLPLILLISSQPELSMANTLNANMIVTEITRSLIGTIGLLVAIPLTAFATAFLLGKKPKRLRRRTLRTEKTISQGT